MLKIKLILSFIHVMVWHIVRYWVTFLIPAFYKRIQVNTIKDLNVKGPVILAMNHPNSFMDAIAITFVCYPVRTNYLARGDAFKPGLTSWLLERIGIVPIFRIQDGGKEGLKKNDEAYRRVNYLLKRNAKIIVFAEGICVQERRLRPLKKGVARMVFGAYEHLNTDDLVVLPVGLNYSRPNKFRSDLFYNIGEPILVKDFIDEYKINPAKANNTFLQVLEPRMKDLITHIDNKDNDAVVYRYEDLCKRDLLKEQNLNYRNLQHDFLVLKQITEKVNDAAKNNQAVLNEFNHKANEYFKQLKKNRLKDWLINPNQNKNVSYVNFIFRFILVVIGFPLYVIGIFGNYLPYLITEKVTQRTVKTKEFFASIAVAFGMIFFLISYLLWFFISYALSPNILIPLLLCTSFILTGWFSLNYHSFKAKTFGMLRILRNKEMHNQLLKKREELIALINKF